jgi:hypothetical protein
MHAVSLVGQLDRFPDHCNPLLLQLPMKSLPQGVYWGSSAKTALGAYRCGSCLDLPLQLMHFYGQLPWQRKGAKRSQPAELYLVHCLRVVEVVADGLQPLTQLLILTDGAISSGFHFHHRFHKFHCQHQHHFEHAPQTDDSKESHSCY